MSIQLTPEQEQRLQAYVSAGAYLSTEDALEAALASIELAAAPDFEGTAEELEELLVAGLNSGEPIEANEAYWNRLRKETERVAADQARIPHP